MEVSYNVRYKKTSFSKNANLDKEGEIVIYSKGFRLKGKGATDKGELINFSDIKEFFFKDEKIIFVTFAKEKYTISEAGSLFDSLLADLYKARNEFLMDALFMKKGRLQAEFDCDFERVSKFGKPINKGTGKVRLYDRSMIMIPKLQDAFVIYYDFINFHEFDDLDYRVKIVTDAGTNTYLSRLGNDFTLFEEKLSNIFGQMYEGLINGFLKNIFPEFHAADLLKLAHKMKGGKPVSLKDIKKMDAEMAKTIEDYILDDPKFLEKISKLKSMASDEDIFYGLAKDPTVTDGVIKWITIALPEYNSVFFTVLPRWQEGVEDTHQTLFFKIIMEKGTPADKMENKIHEVSRAQVILNFSKDPCYLDKRQLKHSPFKYAIRKMPFLRILRRSFVGQASSADITTWKDQAKKCLMACKSGNAKGL